ncbi:MAG: hypothetical protein ACP5OG_02215 [Candidatus Nanoarchaeia archaeon]
MKKPCSNYKILAAIFGFLFIPIPLLFGIALWKIVKRALGG